jgi:hypothetical protein
MRNALRTTSSFILMLLICGGCITPSKSQSGKAPLKVSQAKKPGTKSAPTATSNMTIVSGEISDATNAAAAEFIQRNSKPNIVMSNDDLQFWNSLPNAATPGSAAEAALVLGAAKIAGALSASGSFSESNIDATDSKNNGVDSNNKTFEQICKERGIAPLDALRTNQFLLTSIIFSTVQQAIQRGSASEAFVVAFRQQTAQQAQFWNQLSGNNSERSADTPVATSTEPAAPAVNTANGEFDSTDLKNADNVLMEAQMLADQKLYQAALTKIAMINSQNPLYPVAQERLKSFANGAVQELRQKAAMAYQNSLPLSDKTAKENLLKQAKTHLEEAINSFPNSEQIGTVKDNLQTIDKELDQLKY